MAETIKEFLVRLGFQVDGQRKFEDTIEGATKSVMRLGVEVTAASTAFVAGVGVMANGLEQLYFQAQRTGATAQGINALGYAFSSVGYGADTAKSAIESLASSIRNSPGIASLIESLGVSANQPTEDMLSGLGAKFAQMPSYQGLAYASALGISEPQFLAMRQDTGEFSAWYIDTVKRMGLDTDKAGQSAHGFMEELRKLGAISYALAGEEGGMLSEKLSPVLREINRYLIDNSKSADRLVAAFAGLASFAFRQVVTLGKDVIEIGQGIFRTWQSLDPGTQTLIASLAALAAGLNLATSGWAGLLAASLLVYDDFKAWKENRPHLIPWEGWKDELDAVAKALEYLWDKAKEFRAWLEGKTANLLEAVDPAGIMPSGNTLPGNVPRGHPVPGDPASTIQYLMKQHNLTKEQAVALTQVGFDESGLNPTAVNPKSAALGVFQVLGEEKQGLMQSRLLGQDPYDYETQLDYVVSRIKENSRYAKLRENLELHKYDAGKAAFDYRKYYEVPGGNDDALNDRFGAESAGRAVDLNQSITINVNGNLDHAVAQDVGKLVNPLTARALRVPGR